MIDFMIEGRTFPICEKNFGIPSMRASIISPTLLKSEVIISYKIEGRFTIISFMIVTIALPKPLAPSTSPFSPAFNISGNFPIFEISSIIPPINFPASPKSPAIPDKLPDDIADRAVV